MKKIFLIFALLLCHITGFCGVHVAATPGCIGVDTHGNPVFTITYNISNTVYAWVQTSTGSFIGPIAPVSTVPAGGNFTETYDLPASLDPHQCYVIYLSLDQTTQPPNLDGYVTVCPCNIPTGCLDIDSSGILSFKLSFLSAGTYYLWITDISGTQSGPYAASGPGTFNATTNTWDYSFPLPPNIADECYTVNWVNVDPSLGNPVTDDPNIYDWIPYGTQPQSTTICPCCNANFGYTIDTRTPNTVRYVSEHPVGPTWNFGDGSSATSPSVSYSFSATGSYLTCLSLNDMGSLLLPRGWGCNRCANICITALQNSDPCTEAAFTFTIYTDDGNHVYFSADYLSGGLAGPSYNYQWNFGDASFGTGTNPDHQYSSSGSYNVCLNVFDAKTGAPVCSKCFTVCTYGDQQFGLTKPVANTMENYISRVYPNPTDADINIELISQKNENVDIRVYDVNGKMVIDQSSYVTEGQQNISVSTHTLTNGVYFLQLQNSSDVYRRKFIKK